MTDAPPSAVLTIPPPETRRPRASVAALARLDHLFNRVYGEERNPLYRSGALTVGLIAFLIVTGLYLLLFYRIGTPYASVERITGQAWAGRWIRTAHRLAADAAVVTAVVHALRMFAQRRSWGRRAMPWITGIGLVALILVCGWSGYVMVWDSFGQLVAVEGARLIDLLPLFSEPLGRAFVGEQPIPGAFFFLNLFLHIALPIGMGIVLMLHVSRVARARLLPPARVRWWGAALLVAVSVAWPVMMIPEASAFQVPATIPLDLFYGFWLPAAQVTPAPWVALAWLGGLGLLAAVPRLTRPPAAAQPAPSEVNERLCTGCEQCAHDCPWEAITMVPREDGRATLVARVDPDRCVSCGICAGSCAPMGVGPAGRTGRDQLAAARRFVAAHPPRGDDVVVIACARGAGGLAARGTVDGAPVMAVDCAGTLHTSVVEFLVRGGAGGVLVMACPADDCWNREGATWLEERLFHGREAELQERVDRARVALRHRSLADEAGARDAVARFRGAVRTLARQDAEADIDLIARCEALAGAYASPGNEP
ncbi:MAG: 4Fe-4S dicluster domain-containing protein [Gemmatimonadaceae bacterium]